MTTMRKQDVGVRTAGFNLEGIPLESISYETAMEMWDLGHPRLRKAFFNDRASFEAYMRNHGSFKGIYSESVIK